MRDLTRSLHRHDRRGIDKPNKKHFECRPVPSPVQVLSRRLPTGKCCSLSMLATNSGLLVLCSECHPCVTRRQPYRQQSQVSLNPGLRYSKQSHLRLDPRRVAIRSEFPRLQPLLHPINQRTARTPSAEG